MLRSTFCGATGFYWYLVLCKYISCRHLPPKCSMFSQCCLLHLFCTRSYLYWIILGPGRSACAKANWKPRFRNWWMWRALAQYFPAKLVKIVELDPQCAYIFALHPHGILTCNSWMNFSSEATGFSRLFPGIEMHTGVLLGFAENSHNPVYAAVHQPCLQWSLRSHVTKLCCTTLG